MLSHFLELFSLPSASGVRTRVLADHKVRKYLVLDVLKHPNEYLIIKHTKALML